jgi:UDP-N-acetylglucosamine acyltransferase
VDRIAVLKKAFDLLFRSGHRTAEAIRLAKKEFKGQADVAKILTFMEGTKRGISRAVSPDLEREFDQPV